MTLRICIVLVVVAAITQQNFMTEAGVPDSECHCLSTEKEFLDPEGNSDTVFLKRGKLGEEVKIECSLEDSGTSTWFCTWDCTWIMTSGCNGKTVFVTTTTYSHTTETEPLTTDNLLLACIKESKYKLFEAIMSENISAVRDVLEEGVNINNIVKDMTPLVLAVKLNWIALVNLLLTHCPDRSLSVTTGMNATTLAQREGHTNLTDILEDQSWCQYCPPEERVRCVEQVPLKLKDKSNLVNITGELDTLESEFEKAFEAAGRVEEKQTIAETYMKTVLEVLDKSEPETWIEIDEETCANTSTILQKSNPSYFTPKNRTYHHQNSPNTAIELPENFYENYLDEDGLLTVIFYSYNDLHCATNSIPCNPNVTVPSHVSKANQVNSMIIGATVTESGAWTAENYTICTCDHLTNLAVIMDIHGVLDENLQIFRTFEPAKYFWCVGYGFPLLFVGITLIATQTHGYGTERAHQLNLTFFVFAMRVACGKRQIGNSFVKNNRVKLRGSFALILILGLTWITGFFYVTKGSQALAIIFTILNSLQGVGIFVTMVCLNEKVLKTVTSIPVVRRVLRRIRRESLPDNQPNQLNIAHTEEVS
ncbi:Adhesion G protein-coupled receptor L3-like 2 [Homarus americanus]|uniref:Adhesion G protein-coupled receptor L3-like 2 n=1 Tax=Homarus americanus TaxID=6706 RepID=A0A8J5NCC2_HOMAM|nr:Adhesion G protein-coupled receptor L3-like 2 [Homarus americanus]